MMIRFNFININGDGTFRAGSLKPKIIQPGYQPIFFDINNVDFDTLFYYAIVYLLVYIKL